MLNVQELKESQLDALREVANIGAGHAATALSEITNHRIMVSVPSIRVAPLEEIPDLIATPDEVMVAVLMHISGDLSGESLLFLPMESGVKLASILLRRDVKRLDELDEIELSALKEAANILCGAYMNALSEFMGLKLLPSVPALAVDLARAVLTTVYSDFNEGRDHVISIETQFHMDDFESVEGHFLLLPDLESLEAILHKARLA